MMNPTIVYRSILWCFRLVIVITVPLCQFHDRCTIVISAVAANAATLIMQSSSSTNGGQPPAKKLFLTPSTLDFAEIASNAAAAGDLNFPRRERFVFRPSHLEILEKYFQDNNYPSYETREEIALTCNNLSETAGKLHHFSACRRLLRGKLHHFSAFRRLLRGKLHHFSACRRLLGGKLHHFSAFRRLLW